eukprot:NODE_217_length_14216_cov_0.430545.p9 type:complete len:118 gc:universal NODE_217_length_14216_cov_0.430545:13541-13894(+)
MTVGFGFRPGNQACNFDTDLTYIFPDGYIISLTTVNQMFYVNFPEDALNALKDNIMELVFKQATTDNVHISNIVLYTKAVGVKTSGKTNIVDIGNMGDASSFNFQMLLTVGAILALQ